MTTDTHITGPFIAAIDQGTTSSRCIIFDPDGRIVAVDQKEHEQIFPKPGWVEHDAAEIWTNVQEVVRRGRRQGRHHRRPTSRPSASPTSARPRAVGQEHRRAGPQRASSGRTPAPTRSASELGRNVGQDRFRRETGLPLASYFAGPKVRWLLDNVEGLRERAEAGDILFGTMDTWVIWNLTGGVDGGVHVTDVTNACRTMLMNLHTLEWDEKIARVHRRPGGDAAGDQVLRRGVRRHRGRRRPGRRAGRLRARRPAGGAVRPDLLRRGRGQVHLRHRHLPADEHRRRRRSTRTTAC